jgi:Family of unknown function (DUF5335)
LPGYSRRETAVVSGPGTRYTIAMLATTDLVRDRWSQYLDAVSDELRNEQVSIAVGDRVGPPALEGRRLALQGLSYDRRSDVFEVAAARGGPRLPSVLRHFVENPTRIAVDGPASLYPTLIEVDAADGIRTTITIGRAAPFAG